MNEEQFLSQFSDYNFPNYGFIRLPRVEITSEEKAAAKAPADCSNTDFLESLVKTGFANKISKDIPNYKDYEERIERELAMVKKLNFVDYFLLVWKVMSYTAKNNIAVGFGRGSAGGSLAFYLMGVTGGIDPIQYGLFFERFISEARAKSKIIDGEVYISGSLAPDVDLDIEAKRRPEVIAYLSSLYENRTCKISTMSTLSGKVLIKECCKIVEGMSEEDTKKVADMIPKIFGTVMDIQEACEGVKKEDGTWKTEPVESFSAWCGQHPEVYETALRLRDLNKNKGVHPSGIVVAYDKLEDFLPVEICKSEEGTTEIASSFDMKDVAEMTIKLDVLGIRAASLVAKVLKRINKTVNDFDLEDPSIYAQLQDLKCPHGIFQIEADTNLKVVRAVKPKNLTELSACTALARPGALDFISTFVDNKMESVHPLVDDILKETRGVCLYQEQTMAMFCAIGFSKGEAETVRRVIGKKLVNEIAEWKDKIYQKCIDNNIDTSLGELIYKISEASSSYQFNKSHSASYSALGALSLKLKGSYPQEFFCELLSSAKDEPKPHEELAKIHNELRHFGIELLPPDLAKSEIDFKIEGKNIRFGLGLIKGVGEQLIKNLSSFKYEDCNRFEAFENAKNAGIGITALCALIHSGCFSSWSAEASRASLALQAQLWNILSAKEKTRAMALGPEFKFNLFEVFKKMRTTLDEKGKLLIPDSRAQTILKKYEPHKEVFLMNDKHRELCNFFYERVLLGYSYSISLHDVYKPKYDNLISLEEVEKVPDKSRVEFMAVIAEKPIDSTSKKGNKYARFELVDKVGRVSAILTSAGKTDRYSETKNKHGGKLPTEDSIVYVSGTKAGDSIFIDAIADQCDKIYRKYSDFKKDSAAHEDVE